MAGDMLTWLFVIVVVASTLLAMIAVRGALSLAARCGALGLAAVLMAGGYAGFSELMSRPKPASLEWLRADALSAKVAASHLRENEAIYLWLILEGEDEPRAYRLPWDIEMARQIRAASADARRRQSEVRMRLPFGKRPPGGEQVFHAPPRPAPPPKT